jgi:hypothetical protein
MLVEPMVQKDITLTFGSAYISASACRRLRGTPLSLAV